MVSYFITGRKKNVIVLKNGKNVYPEEIELLISNLPYVAESMVFGTPKNDDLVVSAKIVYDKDMCRTEIWRYFRSRFKRNYLEGYKENKFYSC